MMLAYLSVALKCGGDSCDETWPRIVLAVTSVRSLRKVHHSIICVFLSKIPPCMLLLHKFPIVAPTFTTNILWSNVTTTQIFGLLYATVREIVYFKFGQIYVQAWSFWLRQVNYNNYCSPLVV